MICDADGVTECNRSDCALNGCIASGAPESTAPDVVFIDLPLPRLPQMPSLPGLPDIAGSIARNEHALLIEVAPYALRGLDMAIAAAAVQDNKLDTSELEALKAKLQFWLAPGNALVASVR